MPKPARRRVTRHFSAKFEAELPPERLAEQPFVWNPHSGRLVAPWPRGWPLKVRVAIEPGSSERAAAW